MATEFKFLCTSPEVCSDVKNVLVEMGFRDFKDLKKSPSYDMSAKCDMPVKRGIMGSYDVSQFANSILEKTKHRVALVHVETNG